MSKFFSKKLVKSNLCAVFRGIARNLSWQRRNFFLSTQRNRTALFRKKRQTLYRRLWFQEFFIFFRLFSIFFHYKFLENNFHSKTLTILREKNSAAPLLNFLQCRAAQISDKPSRYQTNPRDIRQTPEISDKPPIN